LPRELLPSYRKYQTEPRSPPQTLGHVVKARSSTPKSSGKGRALLVQERWLLMISTQTGLLSDTSRGAIKAERLPAVKKEESAWGSGARAQGCALVAAAGH
jgi:hypothetical protein